MDRFSFIPRDNPVQAHRIRRFLIAVWTTLLVWVLMLLIHWLGFMDRTGLDSASAGMLACFVVFYTLLRSGLNLRMRDPSLTSAQICSATLVLTFAMYYSSSDARGVFLPLLLVAFLFGIFRLKTLELLADAGFASVCYGLMIGLLMRYRPTDFNLRLELLRWGIVSAVLVWFAFMGTYVGRLRKQLAARYTGVVLALEKSEKLATRDPLTGAHNRRFLLEVLNNERNRHARFGQPFSVCLSAVDSYARIVDSLGAKAGDQVLRGLAKAIQRDLRGTDYLGRVEGEEFVLILAGATITAAHTRTERLRRIVEDFRLPNPGPDIRLTLSSGMASYRKGESVEAMLGRAEDALKRAKSLGGNRVETSADAPGGTDAPMPGERRSEAPTGLSAPR